MIVVQCEAAKASGTDSAAPIRKLNEPISVKPVERAMIITDGPVGGTKAKMAEIMNATQPTKLIMTIHQASDRGCHDHQLWEVSTKARYPEIKKSTDPKRSGAQIKPSWRIHLPTPSQASKVLILKSSVPANWVMLAIHPGSSGRQPINTRERDGVVILLSGGAFAD
ncbi:hypothetical protein [Tateyamaria pelophila]|uniref:hypothetical protein n=1 Tax=Tateyamaria pelophila TaxID=328415 RepID=UPI001CBCBC84|nr:hypothetical protein [Tateyamaria pelophila]